MGLGRPLDAILGAVVVLLILLIRRRLAWVKSTVRDIGALGTALAVIAITIFVGGALLEFRLMPGPAFTLGAVATSVVILAVRRRMDGLRLVPRLPFPHRLDPLVLLGVVSRRGWAGDCDPGRVDHRCCRRQCDPPDPHLTGSVKMSQPVGIR